jgi:hypothetical protein
MPMTYYVSPFCNDTVHRRDHVFVDGRVGGKMMAIAARCSCVGIYPFILLFLEDAIEFHNGAGADTEQVLGRTPSMHLTQSHAFAAAHGLTDVPKHVSQRFRPQTLPTDFTKRF